jgi:hypothetical protein
VVECDLAKVEVAGSNPVSRSNFDPIAADLGQPGSAFFVDRPAVPMESAARSSSGSVAHLLMISWSSVGTGPLRCSTWLGDG